MMMMYKKLCCCYPVFSFSSFSRKGTLFLLPFSTTATTKHSSSQEPPHHFSIVDYLISSYGFSPDKAIKASKYLTHVKSPSNANSVLHFFRQSGFTDAQIRVLISRHPQFLCSDVEKTLKPKFTAFQELGFSEPDLIQLVSKNPVTIRAHNLRPKIQFFRSLLGSNDNLLRAFSRDRFLLSSNIDKRLMANISFLRDLGFTDCQIAHMVTNIPALITRSLSSVKETIRRAEEFGFCRSSGKFLLVVRLVSGWSRASLKEKFEFLKSLGWSEVEIISALRKQPMLLRFSEDYIRGKMEFFTNEVGCDISYLASHPIMFGCSMERRLIPRYFVLRVLKREGLPAGPYSLAWAMAMTELNFIKKFVLPYKQKFPDLHETYMAACTGKVANLQTNHDLKEE